MLPQVAVPGKFTVNRLDSAEPTGRLRVHDFPTYLRDVRVKGFSTFFRPSRALCDKYQICPKCMRSATDYDCGCNNGGPSGGKRKAEDAAHAVSFFAKRKAAMMAANAAP